MKAVAVLDCRTTPTIDVIKFLDKKNHIESFLKLLASGFHLCTMDLVSLKFERTDINQRCRVDTSGPQLMIISGFGRSPDINCIAFRKTIPRNFEAIAEIVFQKDQFSICNRK